MISKVYKFFMNVSVITVVALAFAVACDNDDGKDVSDPLRGQLTTVQTELGTIRGQLETIQDELDPADATVVGTVITDLTTIQNALGGIPATLGPVQLANIRMIQDDLADVQTDLGTVQTQADLGEIPTQLTTIETSLETVQTSLVARLGTIQAEFGINPDLTVDRGSNDPARVTLGVRAAAALGVSTPAALADIKVDHVDLSQSGGSNPVGNVWLSRVDEMDNVLSVQLAVPATKTALQDTVNALFGSGSYDAVVPYMNEANMFRVSDQYFRMTLPSSVNTVQIPVEFMYAYVTTLSSSYQIEGTQNYFSNVPSLLSLEQYSTYGGTSFSALEDSFSNPIGPVMCTDLSGKECFNIDVSSASPSLAAIAYIVLRDAGDATDSGLLDAFRFVFYRDNDSSPAAVNIESGNRVSECSADGDNDFCNTRNNN